MPSDGMSFRCRGRRTRSRSLKRARCITKSTARWENASTPRSPEDTAGETRMVETTSPQPCSRGRVIGEHTTPIGLSRTKRGTSGSTDRDEREVPTDAPATAR